MEQDRYNTDHFLFIIGMISLIMSLALFGLTFYVLPNLLFGLIYDIPSFISEWREWIRASYEVTDYAASQIIALFLFALSLMFALIAYFSSNQIDNKIFRSELELQEEVTHEKKKNRETMILVIKILFTIMMVYVFAQVFQWIIYETS